MIERLYQAAGAPMVSLSLFHKLAIRTLCIALIPLLLVSVLFVRFANDIIIRETRLSNQRAFLQTVALLNNDLQMNKRALSMFTSTPQVIEILSADPDALSPYEQMLELRKLTNIMVVLGLTDSAFRLRVYVPDGFSFAVQRVDMFPLSEIAQEPWFALIERQPFAYIEPRQIDYIYNVRREVLSMATAIQAYALSKEPVAAAVLDLNTGVLRAMLGAQITDADHGLGIIREGTLLLSTQAEGEETLFTQALLTQVEQSRKDGQEEGMTRVGDWYVQWAELEIPDWFLVETMPASKMEDGRRQLLWQMAVLVPMVTALVILATLVTSRTFTRRIHRMAGAVHRYAAGERDIRLTVGSSDVLGSFEQDLNLLFDRMNQLMDDRYRLGQQARSADMNALQSQINPHFLYNTLDMLYWMSKNGETEPLQETIVTLSSFYRKSLARGQEMVTLGDELEHVRLYLTIQNQRYGSAIRAHWAVDASLLEVRMMKLTLQPIVENAVQHGIRHLLPDEGEIRITARREAGCLLIDISDNGAGMTPEQAMALSRGDLSDADSERGSGYGIYNVQRRLRLMYGEAYGLSYESHEGMGTTVHVRIPT